MVSPRSILQGYFFGLLLLRFTRYSSRQPSTYTCSFTYNENVYDSWSPSRINDCKFSLFSRFRMWLFKFLIPLILAVRLEVLAAKPHVTCKRTYRKIGCFDQSKSPAQTYLINDRDPKSKYFQGYVMPWEEFEESIHRWEIFGNIFQ